MVISFDVVADNGDIFRVILSSGEDAFFVRPAFSTILPPNIEIVEIDLERISGSHPASITTLRKISEGIAKCFADNNKAILYYYCDDMAPIPFVGKRNIGLWPQEYRSALFSNMFERYCKNEEISEEIMDIMVVIEEDSRPLYMHLIARTCHAKYLEILKEYISVHYSK